MCNPPSALNLAGGGVRRHWKNAGAYLTCSEALGWLCVGCDLGGPEAAAAPADGTACSALGGLSVTPRDAFGRRLYLQPLGALLSVDGARILGAQLALRPGPASAAIRLAPSPAGATHALLTLLADGAPGAPARRLRLRCGLPCAFEPSPFPGAADVWRIRFGSPEGATLEATRN